MLALHRPEPSEPALSRRPTQARTAAGSSALCSCASLPAFGSRRVWCNGLAVLVPGESVLDQASLQWGVATVFFAVLNPVAAVGLWLTTSLGRRDLAPCRRGANRCCGLQFPAFFRRSGSVQTGLSRSSYFALTWLATRSLPLAPARKQRTGAAHFPAKRSSFRVAKRRQCD